MQEFEKYEEMIPAYLTGKLNENERAELEARLIENPELLATFDEFRQISVGLDALEVVNGGHVDAELLISFGDDPHDLQPATRKEIERHLESCDECREELLLCRVIPEPGWFASMLQWFVAPGMVLRPALAVTAVCLLVLPLLYLYSTREAQYSSVAELHLRSGVREVGVTNILEIRPDDEAARLEFVVPTLDDRLYNFELYDSTGQLLFVEPNNRPKKVLAVEIPSTYFQEGRYRLRIVELGVDLEPTDTFEFEFEFDVRFLD